MGESIRKGQQVHRCAPTNLYLVFVGREEEEEQEQQQKQQQLPDKDLHSVFALKAIR